MKPAKTGAVKISRLYEKYADMLYRIALTHLLNEQDAQDALHDVFEKYLLTTPVFEDESHEKSWFIRVTVNRCLDLLRRRKVRHYTPLDEIDNLKASPSFLEQTEQISVMEHLSNIPEKYKTVIVLHYLEGFSVEETAETLKLSVSAVKMRLKRGREHLKERLREEETHV